MTTNLPCLAEQPQQKPDHPRNDQSEQEASVYAGEVISAHHVQPPFDLLAATPEQCAPVDVCALANRLASAGASFDDGIPDFLRRTA